MLIGLWVLCAVAPATAQNVRAPGLSNERHDDYVAIATQDALLRDDAAPLAERLRIKLAKVHAIAVRDLRQQLELSAAASVYGARASELAGTEGVATAQLAYVLTSVDVINEYGALLASIADNVVREAVVQGLVVEWAIYGMRPAGGAASDDRMFMHKVLWADLASDDVQSAFHLFSAAAEARVPVLRRFLEASTSYGSPPRLELLDAAAERLESGTATTAELDALIDAYLQHHVNCARAIQDARECELNTWHECAALLDPVSAADISLGMVREWLPSLSDETDETALVQALRRVMRTGDVEQRSAADAIWQRLLSNRRDWLSENLCAYGAILGESRFVAQERRRMRQRYAPYSVGIGDDPREKVMLIESWRQLTSAALSSLIALDSAR